MQTITTELRLESGLLTKADNKGFKLEDGAGIRCNRLNDNTLGSSALCAGEGGTASGMSSAHFGTSGTASGMSSAHFGYDGTASGYYSAHFGNGGTASGSGSVHFGEGGIAGYRNQVVISPGKFSDAGDAQFSIFNMRTDTSDATQKTMTSPDPFILRDEKTYALTISVVCRQDTGASHAYFKRQVLIERTGGTASIVGAVQTIGTDINPNSYGLDITISSGVLLGINVTGAASTNLRWLANVQAVEVGFAD